MNKEITDQFQSLIKEINTELFYNFSGSTHSTNLNYIFNNYPMLDDLKNEVLERALDLKSDDNSKMKLFIYQFLKFMNLNTNASRLDDLHYLECKIIDDKNKNFRNINAKQVTEKKRDERIKIDNINKKILKELNPKLQEILENYIGSTKNSVFKDNHDFHKQLFEIDFEETKVLANTFITNTEYLYKELLKWHLSKKMGMNLEDLNFNDLTFLLNSYELTDTYPKFEYTQIYDELSSSLGFENITNPYISSERNINKYLQAIVFPIDPPNTIYGTYYPLTGISRYDSILEMIGEIYLYSFTDPDDFFEFKYIRDPLTTSTFRELFLGLNYNPLWINKSLRFSAESDFIKFLYLRRLTHLRYYASMHIYELEMYTDKTGLNSYEAFIEIINNSLFCKVNPEFYLYSLKDRMHSSYKFLGLIFSYNFSNHIVENFDEQWWRVRESGIYFEKLWSQGGKIFFKDLITETGFELSDLTNIYSVLNNYLS